MENNEKEKKKQLEKIADLIHTADQLNEMSFRVVLEGMVNRGGEEAEFLLIRYLTNINTDLTTRINIIRVMGYIQSTHFLVPLKKIIDTHENIQVKKEAVISVAKFNNRQALNILNQALSNIKNTLLLQVINNEIGKIKKSNPLFSLIPRFQEGEKDPKNFAVTLDILKRILSPADTSLFISYLACGKPILENGAFEILCNTGDFNIHDVILKFFQDRFNKIPCVNQPECDEFYELTAKLKTFYLRNPLMVDQQIDNLGTILYYIKDLRIRELFISIICQSHLPSTIDFLDKIYDMDPALREIIIRESSGNELAVDFLFEKYRTGDIKLKKMIIQSLLDCEKGLDYFYSNFFSLTSEERDMIVQHLPYGTSRTGLSNFITLILQSDQFDLKALLLTKIKENYEFSARETLFEPARENEFFFMEQEYLDTISRLFPIQSIKKLLTKIIFADLSIGKTKKYLGRISEIASEGYAMVFKEKDFFNRLCRKITLYNNIDLNVLLIHVLGQLKTFDMITFKNIEESLQFVTTRRETKISIREGDEVRKTRKNLHEVLFEIRGIEDGLKALERIFSREIHEFGPSNVPDMDQITNSITRQSLCLPLLIQEVTLSIEKNMAESSAEDTRQWVRLLTRFPMLSFHLKDALQKKIRDQKSYLNSEIHKLIQDIPKEPYKILVRLSEKQVTAALRDQCMEIIPHIPIVYESDQWQEGDMLICDSETLKDFILKNTLPSKKLFLLLEKRSDFSSFKTYNPHPLVKPFSAARMVKEIMREIYL